MKVRTITAFLTSTGAVSWVSAVEIDIQSIPTAIAHACHDGMAVSCVTPSDRWVKLTPIRAMVVTASGHAASRSVGKLLNSDVEPQSAFPGFIHSFGP
jgi:hypothetical protein